MMFRRHISRQLAAYRDGRLGGEATRRADAHLARCARCRAELEQTQFASGLVERLPVVEAPESIWRSIETALDRPRVERLSPFRIPRLAVAAVSLLVVAGASVYWYSARQPEAAWEVVRLDGTPAVGTRPIRAKARIGAGDWLQTDGSSRARIKVGEIGRVEVEPNTRLRLLAARPAEHRLSLARGEISATITAPPRLFFVETASSVAVDLGCAYKLQADDAGFGVLRVTAGWVSLEWGGRESAVPAGAICRSRPRIGPGTPFFDDASENLQRALAAFDFENAGSRALDTILAESRVRDTLTLWHLLSRVDPAERARVYDRIAALAPPPGDVSREKALKLDPETLQRWRDELAWTW